MGIASGETITEAPMTQRLSLTDRSTCEEGPAPSIYHGRPAQSGPFISVSSLIDARRELLVKHLTLLSKNQGLR